MKLTITLIVFDWSKTFENLNANECYEKWLEHFKNACNLNIPSTESNKKENKHLGLTKAYWN